jgi:hypothetical protein
LCSLLRPGVQPSADDGGGDDGGGGDDCGGGGGGDGAGNRHRTGGCSVDGRCVSSQPSSLEAATVDDGDAHADTCGRYLNVGLADRL